ncbi:MAG: phosphoglycerate kinase [Deltaproteobacteria bacterium]|nr:phosphoglycerate kinase [Deltaproteobacteria bacterium]MBN2673733.1 phosphoglycerate kinase [Deltaproteobacteria bacterium]
MNQKQILPLTELEVEARRVLVRINVDVPIQNGKIVDDTLLRAAMPTINFLIENGARIVIAGHLGGALGKVDPQYSLEPIASYLAAQQHIGEVYLTDSCVGDAAKSIIAGLRESQVCVLENLGFHAGEFKNDEKLSRQLASYCDIYVNEAFSLGDTVLASTNGILKHARIKVMGLQYAKELASVRKFLGKPARPVVAILGGEKIADNLELLENIFPLLDTLLIGGPMSNTFAAATGGKTGQAVVEEKKLPLARDLIDRAARKNIQLIFPSDVSAGTSMESVVDMPYGTVDNDMKIFDVGPKTIDLYKQTIRKAGTILWKGDMGMAKESCFGTEAVAKAIAGSSAYCGSIGAESAKTIRKLGLEKGFDHVSDGGAATIKMLEGKTLPTIVAMSNAQTMK